MSGSRTWLRLRRLALGLALLFLSACPFSSEQPLSDPAAAEFDRALVGTWKTQDNETKEWYSLTFFPFNDRELAAFTQGGADDELEAYRVFVTVIDTERFLNVRQLGTGEDQEWYFARYKFDGDRLLLRLVDDALFGSTRFASAAALRDFVRRNLSDPRLFESDDPEQPDMVWQREEASN